MTIYIYYLLTVIGIGYFVIQSDLMKKFRMNITIATEAYPWWFMEKIDGVVNCIYCASFWIGLIVAIIIYEEATIHTIFSAFSCMGILYVIHNLFNKK